MDSKADWENLSNMVHKALNFLDRKDISYAEAFFTSTRTTEVTIRNSEIFAQNRADDSGVGFRVVAPGNKVGFACTNSTNEKAVIEAGVQAMSLARLSSEVPNFALPEARRLPELRGLFDSEVAVAKVDEAVDLARRAIESAEGFDERVIAKHGLVVFESGWRGVANTSGVDHVERETRAVIYLGASGEQDGEVTSSCYDVAFSRSLDLEPEQVGESAARMATELFKPRKLKTFKGSVIFGPEAVSSQIFTVLMNALKGENVVTAASPWAGKVGQVVASDSLTVNDNAVLENGFSSRRFDDEGYPSQKSVLIQNGNLLSFLHDATSAHALATENTGNASRSHGGFDMVSSIIGNGYRTRPEVYASNLVVQAGNRTRDELVSEIRKGVLAESLAGFPQAGSGVVSAQLSRAFFISNGETQFPIKGGMVSGVAYDWLNQISGVGNDVKRYQNAIVPSITVEEVQLVGA